MAPLIQASDPPAPPVYETWRECGHCGLVSALPEKQPTFVVECPRCTHTLWKMRKHPFEFPLACGLAGALFYVFALIAPFLEVSAYGRFSLARISTGPIELSSQGFALVGALVMAATVIFPGIKLGIMLLTLGGLETRWFSRRLLRFTFRWYAPLAPWAMIDVYLLGFLVAYTRLTGLANVHLDTALYSLIGLMVSMAAADASLDSEAVWRALDDAPPPVPEHALPHTLIGCHTCGLLNDAPPGARCRRCDTVLHRRKTDSISRSWAFLIAAVMLYIPANIYPVMFITQAATSHDFTIFGGIEELLSYGLWPLALLVFFASITIPLMKLLILAYMLVQTQRRHDTHLLLRTRAFRLIDFIGRWSMIDVFMISILVALVRFGQFADVIAEPGAPCFAAVVVLTMFAVEAFDPRLMWDQAEPQRDGTPVPA